MRTLTKRETKEYAKRLAQSHAKDFKLTWQQVEAMQWDERVKKANELAAAALDALAEVKVHELHRGDFTYEYSHIVQITWGRAVQDHQNAIRRFQGAMSNYRMKQTREMLDDYIKRLGIPNSTWHGDDYMGRMEIGRSWYGAQATLYIKSDLDYDGKVQNPDDPQQYVCYYGFEVEISTGGSSRGLPEAISMKRAFEHAIEAAGCIKTFLDNMRTVRVFGIDETPKESEMTNEEAIAALIGVGDKND